jgi:hypothetical protein
MKKADAEQALRILCHEWCEARGLPAPTGDPAIHYSFSDFKTWLREKHYSNYLDFRSFGGAAGADAAAERWFDQEMQQTWRN